MQDTLEHLVSGTVHRNDANKVLFILNQIDAAAREDNAEDVVSAWQRAISKAGIASGRFYTIYNEQAAVPIESDELRRRYEAKRDVDLEEIRGRIEQVGVERAYRIVGSLESIATGIEKQAVPALRAALERWYRRVMALDLLIVLPTLGLLLGLSIWAGYWNGLSFSPPWIGVLGEAWITMTALGLVLVAAILGVHFWLRGMVARRIVGQLDGTRVPGHLARAFLKNTRARMSVFRSTPLGWGRGSRKRIANVRQAAGQFIQTLNDRYANPSGSGADKTKVSNLNEAADNVQPPRLEAQG